MRAEAQITFSGFRKMVPGIAFRRTTRGACLPRLSELLFLPAWSPGRASAQAEITILRSVGEKKGNEDFFLYGTSTGTGTV